MKFAYSYFLLISLLFTAMQSASSAQTIESDIKDLSANADVILTGKVVNQKAEWSSDHSMILTRVTIKVDEMLKGDNGGSEIVVTHPGGEVGETGEYYSHIPTFLDNEEILLFLKKHPDMSYRVFEGESGKFSLIEDKTTGEKMTAGRQKLSEVEKEIRSSLQTNK